MEHSNERSSGYSHIFCQRCMSPRGHRICIAARTTSSRQAVLHRISRARRPARGADPPFLTRRPLRLNYNPALPLAARKATAAPARCPLADSDGPHPAASRRPAPAHARSVAAIRVPFSQVARPLKAARGFAGARPVYESHCCLCAARSGHTLFTPVPTRSPCAP